MDIRNFEMVQRMQKREEEKNIEEREAFQSINHGKIIVGLAIMEGSVRAYPTHQGRKRHEGKLLQIKNE